VSVVLLDPGINGTACLPNLNLTTFAAYALHAWSFQSQVDLRGPKETSNYSRREAHRLDVVSGQHTADAIESRVDRWKKGDRSGHSANVVKFTLGRPAVLMIPGSRHIRLAHPDKSDLAENSISRGHRIQFQDTKILSTKSRYMDRLFREVIEVELYPNNMNREDGFCQSRSWKPLIHSFKVHRNPHPRSKLSQMSFLEQLVAHHVPASSLFSPRPWKRPISILSHSHTNTAISLLL
jgi:hypothetical protein